MCTWALCGYSCPTSQWNEISIGAATAQQGKALVWVMLTCQTGFVKMHTATSFFQGKQSVLCFMQSTLSLMMSQLANLPNLRHLELEQNTGITGPLADTHPETSSGLCTVVQVCWHCTPLYCC